MVAMHHDHVIATLHVFDHSSGAVTLSQVGVGGTCVGVVEAKAVGPAVVQGEVIVGSNGNRRHGLDGQGGQHRWLGNGDGGSIGTVKSNLA